MIPTVLVLTAVAGLARLSWRLVIPVAVLAWAIIVVPGGANALGAALIALPNAVVGWTLGRVVAKLAWDREHRA